MMTMIYIALLTLFLLVHGCLAISLSSFDDQHEPTFHGVSRKRIPKNSRNRYLHYVIPEEEDRDDIKLLKEFYRSRNEGEKESLIKFPSYSYHPWPTMNNTNNATFDNDDIFDVIVIGGGWAGLSAAMTLESMGITKFKILEARDQIGGRSRTTYEYINGEKVAIDLGSMWLLGGVDNPLYSIINTTGGNIPTVKVPSTEQMFQDKNYGPFSDQQLQYSLNKLYDKFLDFQNLRSDNVAEDEALLVSAELFLKKLSNDLERNVTMQIIANKILLDYAGLIGDMSLLWWNSDYYGGHINSTDLFLPEGFSPLVEAYAAPIASKVLTKAKVIEIDYRSSIIKVRYESGGKEFFLNAKKIIVTVPLGVLKENSIKFIPRLSQRKRQCIRDIGMGRTNKIFMMWNSSDVFWPQHVEVFSNAVPQSPNNTKFMFINSSAYGGKSLLFAFFIGSDIEAFEDKPEFDSVVATSALLELRNMFGNDIKEPEKVVVTKWNKDPYSRGTYSFNKVQIESSPIIRKLLKQPIYRERVYIAGEATSFRYFGTVHGAYFSGIEAATRIIKSLEEQI